MKSRSNGPSVGMRRFAWMSVVLTAMVALVEEPAYGQVLPGDYNADGHGFRRGL